MVLYEARSAKLVTDIVLLGVSLFFPICFILQFLLFHIATSPWYHSMFNHYPELSACPPQRMAFTRLKGRRLSPTRDQYFHAELSRGSESAISAPCYSMMNRLLPSWGWHCAQMPPPLEKPRVTQQRFAPMIRHDGPRSWKRMTGEVETSSSEDNAHHQWRLWLQS